MLLQLSNRLVATAMALSSIAAPAANEIAANEIEEIIVTAGFRPSKLMQSTGSISVLDEMQISDRAAWQITDILGTLPNVNYSSAGSRARFIQMRGIGDIEQFVDPKHYPSVGVLIDTMEVGTTANGAVLSDVAQVEVLRGPQGTQFGANALAGIINIQTQDPGERFNGTVRAGYGNRGHRLVNAVAGGPLTETFGGRLAVQRLQSDGFIHNAFLNAEDTNAIDETSLHGKLIWRGKDDNEVRLTAMYLDLDNGYDAFSLDNSRTTVTDAPGRDAQHTRALAVQSRWAIRGNSRLETQLGWSGHDEVYGYDEDWVFAGFCRDLSCPSGEFSGTDTIRRTRDVYTFDSRIQSESSATTSVAGVYAQARNEALAREHAGTFSSTYDTRRYALYGQLDYVFAPALTLTTGLRVEHFRDAYSDSRRLDTRSSATYWSGAITLAYRPLENTLLYATLSRGVKPGGVNTDARSRQPAISASFTPFLTERLQFNAESLLNKELGVKGDYLKQRLRLRLSLFHTDRHNAQLESWVWDATNFIWSGLLDSTSDAQNYGAELALDYRLAEGISTFANMGYLKTRVDALTTFDLDSGQFVISTGREQAKSPNWQYNAGLEFTLWGGLQGRVEVEGQDSSFFGYYHDGRLDSFTLAHASLSYPLGNLRIQTWIKNLFDKDYTIHGLYFANDPRDGFTRNRSYFQLGEARRYGVTISYRF